MKNKSLSPPQLVNALDLITTGNPKHTLKLVLESRTQVIIKRLHGPDLSNLNEY